MSAIGQADMHYCTDMSAFGGKADYSPMPGQKEDAYLAEAPPGVPPAPALSGASQPRGKARGNVRGTRA